jgi:hypothetical protein
MSWPNPLKTWVDGEPVGAYDLNSQLRDPLLHLFYDAYAARQMLWHYNSHVLAGNAITTVQDTAQNHFFVSYQHTAANGDSFCQSVTLSPGVYKVTLLNKTGSDAGICQMAWDGVVLATGIDTYEAGTTQNVTRTYNLWNLTAELKRHIITVTCTGKNAGSSGYRLYFTSFAFVPYPSEDS